MIAHFFLYTGWGSVVMVVVASAIVAFVVWYAVATVGALIARALWKLHRGMA